MAVYVPNGWGRRFGEGVPGLFWVGLAFGEESGTCEAE